MTAGRGDRDIRPILSDWMDDAAPTHAPERLLEEAFARTMGTSQLRRQPWHGHARRWSQVGGRRRFVATAAVAAAMLVIGAALLGPRYAPSSVGGPAASSIPSPTVAPTPTVVPTLAPTSVTPQASVALSGSVGMATDGTSVWLFTATNQLVRIDPTTNTIAASVPLSSQTDSYQGIAVNKTGLWVTDSDLGVVERYDPETLRFVTKIKVGSTPKGVLVTDTAVWVADLHGGSVTHVDPATNKIVAKTPVGPTGASGPNWLASGFGSIWVDVPNTLSVVRIGASTDTVQTKIALPASATPCGGLVVGAQAVWVTTCSNGIIATRIDPTTNAATGTVDLGGHGYVFAMVGGSPWIAPEGNRIVRIDPTSNVIDKAISPVANFSGGGDMVVASGSLWVVDYANDQILRLPLADLAN